MFFALAVGAALLSEPVVLGGPAELKLGMSRTDAAWTTAFLGQREPCAAALASDPRAHVLTCSFSPAIPEGNTPCDYYLAVAAFGHPNGFNSLRPKCGSSLATSARYFSSLLPSRTMKDT